MALDENIFEVELNTQKQSWARWIVNNSCFIRKDLVGTFKLMTMLLHSTCSYQDEKLFYTFIFKHHLCCKGRCIYASLEDAITGHEFFVDHLKQHHHEGADNAKRP